MMAIVVALIELGGAHWASAHQPEATRLDALGIALLVVGALALALRRRWRVATFVITLATTVVYALLGFPYGPVFLAILIAMFGAIRTGHRIAVWIGLGVSYVAFLAAGLTFGHLGSYTLRQPGVEMSIQVAVWFVLAVVLAEGIRVRTAHFAEMRRTMVEQERAREEQERRQATEERLRIARELHDVLGHHLSLISVQAGVGLHLMEEHPDQARAALEAIKTASAEALGEVRSVLGVLRPKEEKAPRAPVPSLANLDALIEPAATAIVGTPRPLPPEIDRAAYRIVQESLTNVRRHAGPQATAAVTIDYRADRLTVSIADNGRGAPVATPSDPRSGEGTGIAGMRTRAKALGGELAAGPNPGGGFLVSASLPIPQPTAPEEACS